MEDKAKKLLDSKYDSLLSEIYDIQERLVNQKKDLFRYEWEKIINNNHHCRNIFSTVVILFFYKFISYGIPKMSLTFLPSSIRPLFNTALSLIEHVIRPFTLPILSNE